MKAARLLQAGGYTVVYDDLGSEVRAAQLPAHAPPPGKLARAVTAAHSYTHPLALAQPALACVHARAAGGP